MTDDEKMVADEFIAEKMGFRMSDTPRTDAAEFYISDRAESCIDSMTCREIEREINRLRGALERIEIISVNHQMTDPELLEKRDIDALAEIGGDTCDWTMVAIHAQEGLGNHE